MAVTWDAIVVGARCAGAPTAMLLARAGRRVLLLEKARFPRDTLSTHYIHQPGVACLAEWGLLDEVAATGCPPLDRAVYQVADVHMVGCSMPVDGQRAAYAPRRDVLDPILANAAAASGAEFHDGCAVTDLLWDNGRVTGVRYTDRTGSHEARADLVIGADGMRSTVARLVEAPMTLEDPLMTCVYYSYFTGVPADFELYEAPRRWIGCAPTNDGQTLIAAYFPQSEFDTVRADALPHYLANIKQTAPDLYARVQDGQRIGRLFGTGDQRNFFRQATGPGWALVGDAGHHKDSISGRGITDAFLQARLLVEYIDDLKAFGGARDDLLMEHYQNTLIVAGLTVQPDRLRLLRAIARDPELVERYFSTVAGVVSVEDLYPEELLLESI
ncbi:MAG TPA: NAD(P)/FAD-dependent oxidoreductase [Pseudonocardiaceae bacterium]|jgi:flavin-dependent dehydrogenase